MREHLFGGRLVFGSHGIFSPAWTALDLDRCLGEGVQLTGEAQARFCAVDRAFGPAVVPLRSSSSGNLHLWLHHAPMSVTLRDVCVVRQLAEYGSQIAQTRSARSDCLEIYPKPDVNFRWPFGLGSVLLEPGPLLEGLEVPVEAPKDEQITRFVEQPLYEFPSLADGLRELRTLKRDSHPLISMPSQPPTTSVIRHFDERVKRWLEEGPKLGEHNTALGAVAFWYCVQGWPPDALEDVVWEWQRTKATGCREWIQDGPESCRGHVRRWVRSVLKGYQPYEKVGAAIDDAGVSASDVVLGLELFPKDVRLQRAFFEFCRFVRPRLSRYYKSGVMPISSHLRWRSFSERQYRVLRDQLADAGLCTPVYSASVGRSTLYQVTLPVAKGEEFASWEVGVWEVGGRDRENLRRHFSSDQVKRIFPGAQFGTVSGIR
jgi:hypothetical protein